MFDPAKFAMQMIQNNPQVMNNPMAKQYLEIIQNGDSAKGQEVANNILKTYGMTKDQAAPSSWIGPEPAHLPLRTLP